MLWRGMLASPAQVQHGKAPGFRSTSYTSCRVWTKHGIF
jgi:hypothetical protein